MKRNLAISVFLLIQWVLILSGCYANEISIPNESLNFEPQVKISPDERYLAVVLGRRDQKTKQLLNKKIYIVDLEQDNAARMIPNPFVLGLSWKSREQRNTLYFIEPGKSCDPDEWPIDILRSYNITDDELTASTTESELTPEWIPFEIKCSPNGKFIALNFAVQDKNDFTSFTNEFAISFDNGKNFSVFETNPTIIRFCWVDDEEIFIQLSDGIKAGKITQSGIKYYNSYTQDNIKRLLGSFNQKPLWISDKQLFLGETNICELNNKKVICHTDGSRYLAFQCNDKMYVLDDKLEVICEKTLAEYKIVGISAERNSVFLLNEDGQDIISKYDLNDNSISEILSARDLHIP